MSPGESRQAASRCVADKSEMIYHKALFVEDRAKQETNT